ncbi:g6337 [Coccomyxa viridis]|uniref:G6337 protein n=1 Tax=Coccomyxa viridis TaxID=1274662 RepID=A0ABP1G1S1_9CHLO
MGSKHTYVRQQHEAQTFQEYKFSASQKRALSATETKGGETRRQALGSIVIETNEDLPEPPEKDFWEGGAWEWFGKLTIAVVPLLIAAALGTGIFAAATYNTGADKVLLPAGEDSPAQIVDSQQ